MHTLHNRSITTCGTTFMVLGINCETLTSALGGQLFYTCGDVLVQVMPSLAKLTSELYLFSPVKRYLATNRDSGGIINLGQFEPGTELIFGVWVRDTKHTFLTGPSSRNPDGFPHAYITPIRPGVAIVRFRDNWGGETQTVNDFLGDFEETLAYPISAPPSTLPKQNLVFARFNDSSQLRHSSIKRAS